MKALMHYLLLVGIPVLGVLGGLQLGESLQAPTSVAGAWILRQPQAPDNDSCVEGQTLTTATRFVVSQSGPKLGLAWGDLNAAGDIDGRTVRTSSTQLELTANLESRGVLQGRVRFPTCSGTPSFSFSAKRAETS